MKAKPKPRSPRRIELRWTLQEAANHTGCAEETIRRNLLAMGYETGKAVRYLVSDIFKVLVKRKEYEQTRLLEEQANKLARKREIECGNLIEKTTMEQAIAAKWGPARDFMLGAPSVYAAKVNPTDLQAGRRGLEELRDAWLRVCRENPV